jgi:hypothetical protein
MPNFSLSSQLFTKTAGCMSSAMPPHITCLPLLKPQTSYPMPKCLPCAVRLCHHISDASPKPRSYSSVDTLSAFFCPLTFSVIPQLADVGNDTPKSYVQSLAMDFYLNPRCEVSSGIFPGGSKLSLLLYLIS